MTDKEVEDRIATGLKRNDIFSLIPEGSNRILDIGYGDGALLLRLKHQKNCTELYGVETNTQNFKKMEGLLDGNWNMYLNADNNHLPDAFLGFFNYTIMHDVLEHIYDPWMFLSYIRRYVSPDGRLLLVCPNAQYWQTIFSLLHGDFPYGLDFYFNEDHIRWFTPKSMIEMALLAGLKVHECHLLLTSKINKKLAAYLGKNPHGKVLSLPPEGFDPRHYLNYFPPNVSDINLDESIEILFKKPKNTGNLSFYAVKIILICSVAHMEQELRELTPGEMKNRREAFMKKHFKTYQERLPTEWKAYIWQPG